MNRHYTSQTQATQTGATKMDKQATNQTPQEKALAKFEHLREEWYNWERRLTAEKKDLEAKLVEKGATEFIRWHGEDAMISETKLVWAARITTALKKHWSGEMELEKLHNIVAYAATSMRDALLKDPYRHNSTSLGSNWAEECKNRAYSNMIAGYDHYHRIDILQDTIETAFPESLATVL